MRQNDDLTGVVFECRSQQGLLVRGRVLLDLYFLVRTRSLKSNSPIAGLGKAVLAETYCCSTENTSPNSQSEVAIPGTFVDRFGLFGDWDVIGREDVTAEQLVFPQTMISYMHPKGECEFRWGEVSVPIARSESWMRDVGCFSTRIASALLADYSLIHQGASQVVPEKLRNRLLLQHVDLRFHPRRDEVHGLAKVSSGISYYKYASKSGHSPECLLELLNK